MIWTTLSVVVCLVLVIKLTFFTDMGRRESRLFYRAMLLLSAVYAFKQVINVLYGLEQPGPLSVLFHTTLLVGAVFLKPHHLPWNHTHDARATTDSEVHCSHSSRLGDLLCRIWRAVLHGLGRRDEGGAQGNPAAQPGSGAAHRGSEGRKHSQR